MSLLASAPSEGGAGVSLYLWLVVGSNKTSLTQIGGEGKGREKGLERISEKLEFWNLL